ncbi:G patch domain-containing protein 1 homolog [Drosophila serrata]|uniref:G patch domain-containing protein 1 homolog n=1 Tax=Drosophila serrata TaxID=7274 RepID=UPI000A1D18CE|nr:G patch domain-containing protein 1 homolog [Drosophila serrata]
MDEEEHLHRFGTPLEPLEKDEVPAKKPVAIEDQIVKDENGKRRFHGAFTGGFSAGFWNTVGSLEGWTPQTFKSSRAEKATPRALQKPEDFMDKEDLGEFGIAPQGVRTRDEFAKEDEQEQRTGQRRRKLMQPEIVGPIPGMPVLEQLLRPVRDKVAVRILKSMGWKPGQGVGPRQTRKEKRQATARNQREQYLLEHYGAEGLPSKSLTNEGHSSGGDEPVDDEDDEDITFAPDDYEPIFYTPKENRFGMSYSGLSRDPILSKSSGSSATTMQHINLFGQLEAQAKSKQLSIRGQAFGVGAFEEEDDDIYARDDMTRYDFSLADKKPKQKKQQHIQQRHVIDGFSEDKSGAALQKPYAIDLPRDFAPRNWLQRKSRFAPMDKERARKLETNTEYKRTGLGRHDLNPDQRAQLLGEQKPEEKQEEEPPKGNPFKDRGKSLLERINARTEGFTKGGIITESGEEQNTEMSKEVKETNAVIQEKAALKTKDLLGQSSSSGTFKPFLADEAKQLRYEKFVASNLKDDAAITDFLANLQPVTLSQWDREMEKKEFIQAAKIYRPLDGLMNDRFVSEATVQAEQVKEQQKAPEERKVVMERTKTMWKPASLLCKRYNIAEPFGGAMLEPEKELKAKPKISVFDYLETSVNTKSNFQTPTIIPKHIEKPKPKEVEPPAPTAASAPAPPVLEQEKPPQKETEPVKSTFVPKTPLEQAVDESRNKPISEKVDLFKSIFDDSDEEEEEVKEAPTNTVQDKLAALQEALGLPSSASTSAAAVNVLRNTSPPRGIFAALFKPPDEQASKEAPPQPPKFAPIEGNKLKISYKSREERLRNDKELAMAEVPPEDVYGPKLPGAVPQRPSLAPEDQAEASIDAKLQQLWQQHAPKKRKAEKWVEKKVVSSSEDSEDSTSDDSSSSSSDSSPVSKAKRSKSSKAKKSHKNSSSKKSKKSKLKTKKKSKKSDRSKHKTKKKKSKH